MPVTYTIGAGAPNPFAVIPQPKARYARSHITGVKSIFTVDTTFSANSKLLVGFVPSGAILSDNSFIRVAAMTSGAFDVGLDPNPVLSGSLAAPTITSSASANQTVLATGLSLASAANLKMKNAVAAANDLKALWELMGASSDPGLLYALYLTITTAPGASGAISAEGWYHTDV